MVIELTTPLTQRLTQLSAQTSTPLPEIVETLLEAQLVMLESNELLSA